MPSVTNPLTPVGARWHDALMKLLGILGACAVLAMTSACGAPAAPKEASPAKVRVSVPIAVLAIDASFLDKRLTCNRMTGDYAALHTGAFVYLRDVATSARVARGRLGTPPVSPPKGVCAWGASINAELTPGHEYFASAGKWNSRQFGTAVLARQAHYLVINAR